MLKNFGMGGGDFPSFWQRDKSYLAVMEYFYKSL